MLAPLGTEEKDILKIKIRRIKEKYLPRTRIFYTFTLFLLIISSLGAFSWLFDIGLKYEPKILKNNPSIAFNMYTSISGASFAFFIFSRFEMRRNEEQLKQLEDELELLEIADGDNLLRSEKLFRQSQDNLKRYYDINLGHYRWIFPVGIITIILGSAIIGGTIWVFRNAIKDSIAPILIGAVSGVLVDFVGAVLIHMYTETVKSSVAFHSQLMKSSHAHFANMLAFKIKDDDKKDETFAELAKLMIQTSVEPIEPKK